MPSFTKRHVAAVLLTIVSAIAALGTWRAHLGCGGATVRGGTEKAHADVVDGGAVADGGSDDAGADGATAITSCTDPIMIGADVIGSFTESILSPHQFEWVGKPSLALVASHAIVRPMPPAIIALELAEPFFSIEFAAAELCSTEEASASRLRLLCLGEAARLTSIEVRVEHLGRVLVVSVDGVDGEPHTPELAGLCMTLNSKIPKRDITRLQRTFLDDSVSERCRSHVGQKRTVPATFDRVPLPAGHELAPKGTCPSSTRCCNDNNTFLRLLLPIDSASFQDLGVLSNQCGGCVAVRYPKLNGIRVECADESVSRRIAFQLGDYLYYADVDRVKRVPLPCGAKLDFRFTKRGTLRPIEDNQLD